jgi:GntR family transcriptional regulator
MKRPTMPRPRQNTIPLYTQIASALRAEMENGAWAVGAKLPAIEELAGRFGVAPLTMRQALMTLEDEGLVRCRQGIGTIVQKDRRAQRWLRLPTDWNSLVGMTDLLKPRMTLVEASDRTPNLRPEDGVSAGAYKFLKRVHFRDDEPFCVIEFFLSAKIYLRAPKQFRNNVVVPILDRMKGVVIKKVMHQVSIDVANSTIAELLAMPLGGPVAKVHRTIADDAGVVIYAADVLYKSNVVQLDMDLSPRPGKRGAPSEA